MTVSGWGLAVAGGVVEAWSVSVGCGPVGVEVGAAGEPVGVLVDWVVAVGLGVLRELLPLESPVVFVPADTVAAIRAAATRIRKPNFKPCL
jgi:hypothetical protein